MKYFLIGWSLVAFGWWLTALRLLATGCRKTNPSNSGARKSISVFKPLPPVRDEKERSALTATIRSFASQLLPADELIVGMNAADAANWQAAVGVWREACSGARIEVVAREVPRQCANPKVAWLQVLAPSARGELWLWSDADVSATPGLLDAMAAQLAASGANAVTAPYAVRHLECAQGVLDALFVNVEFLPGVLLLGRSKHQDFAYGAATIFSAEIFCQRGDWHKLGAALADDNKLGNLLQPVALGTELVSTFTKPAGWVGAFQHYYRWQKTIRWCRPGGFAALIVLMPAIGWLLTAFLAEERFYLGGFAAVLAGEILVALLACRMVGCRLPPASWIGVLMWPPARVLVWLLVWLPLPVLWSGRQREWFAPQQNGSDD
jgi:ceramide glucosyltransferase